MSEPRTPGWIYVLASQSHPCIVKIGRTSRHTPGRMIEVDRSAYAAFGPWTEVWSRAVADCAHVEEAAHRMLANRRVKLNRLPCRELFRVDSAEACRVVEAAVGSLIVARWPLPVPMQRSAARFTRPKRRLPRRAVAAIVMLPVMVWLIGLLLRA
jgi:T5orf172 domain